MCSVALHTGMEKMRNAVIDWALVLAFLSFFGGIIIDKESDHAITNFIYMDINASNQCLKQSEIMLK